MKLNISKIIFVILLSLTLILIAFSFFAIFSVRNNKVPFVFGYASLKLVSDSMSPTYVSGDVVFIKKADFPDISVGDVITFYSTDPRIEGKMNTHRVIDIKTDDEERYYFVTKGDYNSEADAYPVYGDQLIGVISGKNTFLSTVFMLLSNGWIYFAFIIIPLLIILSTSIRQFVRVVSITLKSDEQTGE